MIFTGARWRKWALLLIVIALAAPVFFLKEGATGSDMSAYLEMGRRLSAGQGYIASPEAVQSLYSRVRSPLYAGLFAISFLLFGASVSSALLVTKVTTFGSIIIVYLLLKSVYNARTGLAVVALVVTSTYMMSFPVHLYIDQPMAFFMLLSLYLIVIALDKADFTWSWAAGMALGAGMLTKELAVLWLPLPLYLALGVTRWRCRRNLLTLISFGLGFGILPAAWWLYYYRATGEIFLFSSYRQLLPWNSLVWGLLAIVLAGPLILYGAYGIYQRVRLTAWLRQVVRLCSFLSRFSVWFSWLVFTAVFNVGLILRTGFPFKLTQLPLRLEGIVDFVSRTAEWEFLFNFLWGAVIVVALSTLFKRRLGDRVLFWSLQACWPLALMNLAGSYALKVRYGMPLLWLGFVVLARALVWLLECLDCLWQILRRNERNLWWRPSSVALGALVVYALWIGQMIPKTYAYHSSPYYINLDDNVSGIHEASQWIKENVPRQAKLAADFHHIQPLQFFTGGYTFERFFSSSDWEPSKEVWPYQRAVSLRVEKGKLGFYSDVKNSYQAFISKPLYIQSIELKAGVKFSVLSEQALVHFLKEYAIDYLVLTASSVSSLGLLVTPDYFVDQPIFQPMFSTHWRQKSYDLALHILKVDRDCLEYADYPVMIAQNTWPKLLEAAKSLLGEEFKLDMLIHALGNGPIVFRPASPRNFKLYQQVADAYAARDDVDLAAFEYHLALIESPDSASQLARVARLWVNEHGNVAGPWLLLGDIYVLQERVDLAQEAYQRALKATNGSSHTYAAAHLGLGKIYLASGQNTLALEQFESALQASRFGAAETQRQFFIAQANLYQAQGNIDLAIATYRDALDINSSATFTFQLPANIDFVRQFDRSQVNVSPGAVVYPAVFVVEEQPHPVLFAHPPSKVQYTVRLPRAATLRFTPMLAPAVWQVGKGDGVQFDIYIQDSRSRRNIFSKYIDPKNILTDRLWHEHELDLSLWADRTVTLTLSTEPGPNSDDRYDWAGWGELRIEQPVMYNFLALLPQADLGSADAEQVRRDTLTIDQEARPILFQHPTSWITYRQVQVPGQAKLRFGLGLDPATWGPDKGDGVTYNVYVRKPQEPYVLYQIFHRYVNPKQSVDDRHWLDEAVDLRDYGKQTVDFIFETTPGPAGNMSFDWSGWSAPVIVDERHSYYIAPD